jgi:hypothetical protein
MLPMKKNCRQGARDIVADGLTKKYCCSKTYEDCITEKRHQTKVVKKKDEEETPVKFSQYF